MHNPGMTPQEIESTLNELQAGNCVRIRTLALPPLIDHCMKTLTDFDLHITSWQGMATLRPGGAWQPSSCILKQPAAFK